MRAAAKRAMQRRRAEEPLPSADRWLLSWSDFVTLLLALFAAMYAGASVDLAKAKLVAQSVGSALGTAGPGKGEPRDATPSSSAAPCSEPCERRRDETTNPKRLLLSPPPPDATRALE